MENDDQYYDDPLRAYVKELSRIPALERDDDILYIEQVKAGGGSAEAARVRLLEANLQVVVSVAERYRSDRVHILDLIQRGNEGLLRAVNNLSDCPGVPFASYAEPFIERAVIDALNAEPAGT